MRGQEGSERALEPLRTQGAAGVGPPLEGSGHLCR